LEGVRFRGHTGAAFRLSLEHADRSRDLLIVWAHGQGLVGFLLVTAGCAVAVAAATWLVRRFSPHASGSGIPHVEAVVRGELPPAPFSLIPVKFFGGLMAIGSGLALGREGQPAELRAGLIGAAVGMLAWFAPELVGGGDAISQRTLAGAETLALLPAIFLLRLGLGAVSYAAGTPGGLFAPMLVLGAQLGLFLGLISRLAIPDLAIQPEGFAVVGMAAFFTGVVRAPLTGIVLVIEMTASVTMLLPMLAACFVAMLVPTLLRDPPIYDSLRELTLRRVNQSSSQ
jgi:H+/Cl- antiporter ClcA